MTDSEKFDLILSKLDKIDRLEERFDKLENRFDKLEERFDRLENDVSDIKLILENEIRTNIKRVAEGHLDLSRNLHEALKIDNEKEMLSIRVSVLETEMRRIKTRLEIA